MVYLPDGLEVRFAIAHRGEQKSEFRWPDVVQLGRHAPNGEYCELVVRHGQVIAWLEFAAEGDTVYGRATPVTSACEDATIVIEARRAWPEVGGAALADFRITPITSGAPRIWDPDDDRIVACEASFNGPVGFMAGRISRTISLEELDRRIGEARIAYLAASPGRDGTLTGCLEGIEAAILWNTYWAPSAGKVVTVVSRDWCVEGNYGEYVLFAWDTFFASLLAAVHDVDLARMIIDAELEEFTERGFAPNVGCELGKSRDRSFPPVGAYCVWKLHQAHPDADALARWFPKLLGWHDWWFTARDGNGDGLLEWGSDDIPSPHPQWQSHTLQATRYESGLDNSPIYDDVTFNESTNTMEMADVGLNALYTADAWALSEMAEALGKTDIRDRLRSEWQTMSGRINRDLWCPEQGIYLNRYWDGRWCERIAATSFYPLLAGIVPEDRARRMVEEHLLNPEEFWGEWVIPSISRDDSAYPDQAYWRGRIWGPMNFLIHEGLKRSGFDTVARELAEKSLRLFRKEWDREGHIHENQNADTGDGDDARYSEPIYHWGALLAYLSLAERD
jgi:putative isomerase